jgi:hypothetical protein
MLTRVAPIAAMAGLVMAPLSMAAPGGECLHTIPACRLLDTRLPSGSPPLQHLDARPVQVAGTCLLPAEATAVAVTLTAIAPSGDGELALAMSSGGVATQAPSLVLPFPDGRTRALFGVAALSAADELLISASLPNGGEVHAGVDVTALLGRPRAVANSFSGDEDSLCIQINLIANEVDGDPALVQLGTDPANGELFLYDSSQPSGLGAPVSAGATLGPSPQTLCYQPAATFHGMDSFTYHGLDGCTTSEPATIPITVNDIN